MKIATTHAAHNNILQSCKHQVFWCLSSLECHYLQTISTKWEKSNTVSPVILQMTWVLDKLVWSPPTCRLDGFSATILGWWLSCLFFKGPEKNPDLITKVKCRNTYCSIDAKAQYSSSGTMQGPSTEELGGCVREGLKRPRKSFEWQGEIYFLFHIGTSCLPAFLAFLLSFLSPIHPSMNEVFFLLMW